MGAGSGREAVLPTEGQGARMDAISRGRMLRILSLTHSLPKEEPDSRAENMFQSTGFHMWRKRAKVYGPHVGIFLEMFFISRT